MLKTKVHSCIHPIPSHPLIAFDHGSCDIRGATCISDAVIDIIKTYASCFQQKNRELLLSSHPFLVAFLFPLFDHTHRIPRLCLTLIYWHLTLGFNIYWDFTPFPIALFVHVWPFGSIENRRQNYVDQNSKFLEIKHVIYLNVCEKGIIKLI